MSRGTSADRAREQAVARANAQALRAAIHRQWRLGLNDSRIGAVLGVRRQTVKTLREELGLAPNHGGEE